MTSGDTKQTDDEWTYHVCVTCGRLKREDLFEEGDCTCNDCYAAGSSGVNWVENPDGEGWIAR